MSPAAVALLLMIDMMLSGRSRIMVSSLLMWMLHIDAAASAAVDGACDEPRFLSPISTPIARLDRRTASTLT